MAGAEARSRWPEILKIYEKIVKGIGKRACIRAFHCRAPKGRWRAINMGFKL